MAQGHSYDEVMGYDLVQLTAISHLSIERSKREQLSMFSLTRVAMLGDDNTAKQVVKDLQE